MKGGNETALASKCALFQQTKMNWILGNGQVETCLKEAQNRSYPKEKEKENKVQTFRTAC
jgi:hypothetical protein